jgi:hypothetical protein
VLVEVQHIGDDVGLHIVLLFIPLVQWLVLEKLLVLDVEQDLVTRCSFDVLLNLVSVRCSYLFQSLLGQGNDSCVSSIVDFVRVPELLLDTIQGLPVVGQALIDIGLKHVSTITNKLDPLEELLSVFVHEEVVAPEIDDYQEHELS